MEWDESDLESQLERLIAKKCRLNLSFCYVFISIVFGIVKVIIKSDQSSYSFIDFKTEYPITTLTKEGPEKFSDMIHLDYVFRGGE
jgi:hypothetical protein